MKNYRSAFLSLLLLLTVAGCGKEQFGGAVKSESQQAEGLTSYVTNTCSQMTLIKPKVDILYVVDNSASNTYISNSIRNTIVKTVDSISKEFDYRVIGTGLLPVGSNPNSEFQVLTNSSVDPYSGNERIITASQFDFFNGSVSGGSSEHGLRRIVEFINANSGGSNSAFRQGANTLVVLISNGRDREVEPQGNTGNNAPGFSSSTYNTRLASLRGIKTNLNALNFRMLAVTAHDTCQSGWQNSTRSYSNIAKALYVDSGAQDSSTQDSYDLCNSSVISGLFSSVNSSIKQVLVPHRYKYWPITFTNTAFDQATLKVFKSSPGSAQVRLTSGFSLITNPNYPNGFNTRTYPTVGEPSTAKYLLEFTNEIVYPECITATSSSKVEYFKFIVLPQEPKLATMVVRINGTDIPASATNGWSYAGNTTQNIKAAYPNPGDDQPAVNKSGFMIQLNGSGNYYKSGDSIEVNYVGEGI